MRKTGAVRYVFFIFLGALQAFVFALSKNLAPFAAVVRLPFLWCWKGRARPGAKGAVWFCLVARRWRRGYRLLLGGVQALCHVGVGGLFHGVIQGGEHERAFVSELVGQGNAQ